MSLSSPGQKPKNASTVARFQVGIGVEVASSNLCSRSVITDGRDLPLKAGSAGGRKTYTFTVLDGQSHPQQQPQMLA